jgi:hypothetical protein
VRFIRPRQVPEMIGCRGVRFGGLSKKAASRGSSKSKAAMVMLVVPGGDVTETRGRARGIGSARETAGVPDRQPKARRHRAQLVRRAAEGATLFRQLPAGEQVRVAKPGPGIP